MPTSRTRDRSILPAAAILWVVIFISALAWSAWQPKDIFTWFLEVVPALVGVALLAATRRRFPLTPLVYWLILVHCLILMVGGHYTYAEVPLFDRLGEWFGWTRNNYDKVGHFAQGFIPAMIAREIFIRREVVREGPLAELSRRLLLPGPERCL